MAKHLKECQTTITYDNVEILASTSRGQNYLETLEALYIRQHNPQINTRDEYRARELTIKLVPWNMVGEQLGDLGNLGIKMNDFIPNV